MPAPFPKNYVLEPKAHLHGSGDGSSLENVNGQPVPNGATCFVEDQATWYYFAKFSTASPSGDSVIATVQGTGIPGRWVQIPSGGGAAALPLSTVFYVDNGTTTPMGDQNGSIDTPYASLQAAITARASADFIATFLIVPTLTSYGDVTIPDGVNASLVGEGGPGNSGPPTIGNVTIGASSFLSIEDVNAGDVTGTGAFRAFSTFSVGVVNVAQFVAAGEGFNDPSSIVTGNITTTQNVALSNLTVLGSIVSATDVSLRQSNAVNVTTGTGATLFVDLFSLTSIRTNGGAITIGAGGATEILDAPSVSVSRDVADVSAAPTVIYQDVAFTGARAGDSFAVAISACTPNPPVGIALGVPICITDDVVSVPAILQADAETATIELTLTRLTVAGVLS